jgi:hypothetical protein
MTQDVKLNTHALLLAPNTVNNRDTKSLSIWEILHISKDVQESAKVIGDVVGAVSTVVSWAGTVQSALKLVGFIKPEPNPFDTLYQRIQNDLKQLLTTTLAGATEERLRDVAEQLAITRTAAQNANEYILLGQPNDEFQINRLAIADRDSLQVMNLLAAPEWWLRSFDPSPAAILGPQIVKSGDIPFLRLSDYWWHPAEPGAPAIGAFNPPSPSNGLIWDYRHILPVYLQAVAARLVVLRARAATTNAFLQLAKNEVPGYVAFLNQQYSRIKESWFQNHCCRTGGNFHHSHILLEQLKLTPAHISGVTGIHFIMILTTHHRPTMKTCRCTKNLSQSVGGKCTTQSDWVNCSG